MIYFTYYTHIYTHYASQPQTNTCQKTHSASVVAGPHVFEVDEKKKGKKILELDCRGLEFTEFKSDVSYLYDIEAIFTDTLQGEWEAKGTDSSTPFTGIDLSEGEWYDYDEKAGEEVSIKEITWTVGR